MTTPETEEQRGLLDHSKVTTLPTQKYNAETKKLEQYNQTEKKDTIEQETKEAKEEHVSETDAILEMLKNYEKHPTNFVTNIASAEKFVVENYLHSHKTEVYPIIDFYVKNHFELSSDGCKNVKTRWTTKVEEAKLKAEKDAEAKRREAREVKNVVVKEEKTGQSVIVSTKLDDKDVSLKITFDSRDFAHRWCTEFIADGADEAKYRSSGNVINSQAIVDWCKECASKALNTARTIAFDTVSELVSLAKARSEEIACLDPVYVMEKEAKIKAEKRIKANKEADEYAKKTDKYAGVHHKTSKKTYFDCNIPKDYRVGLGGIEKCTWAKDYETKELVQEWDFISIIRIMVTGSFQSNEGNEIVELQYIDRGDRTTIYTPLATVLGMKEFREKLRPRNIRIDDHDLKDMIKFFNTCIDANKDNEAFKTGWCFSSTGWKGNDYTQFVAGHRLFENIDSECVESRCIYTDPHMEGVFDPRGSIEVWVASVNPLMVYDRMRFVCYAAFASVILKFLNVDSFTIDIYGGIPGKNNDKSSSGKTSMTVIAISGFGNVLPGDEASLFNTCYGTANFVENLIVKYTDLPVLLDESTKLSKDVREELAYRISSRVTKGRASDGNGGIQKTHRKSSVAFVTGENPLIPRESNIGSKVRCPTVQGGIGVDGIGDIVRDGREGCSLNSGHLLKPFLAVFFKNKDKVTPYFIEARNRLENSVDNDLAKRQAMYFAAIETAGKLLEMVFDTIEIERKDPKDVVNTVWEHSVSSHPIEAQWMDALRDTWEWYKWCSIP